MGVKSPPVRNPVKRHGAYRDQKPIHPSDLSFFVKHICAGQTLQLQVHGRTLLYPVLKKITHPTQGVVWTDAIGDLEIFYDEQIFCVYIKNVTKNCDLTIKFKIV